MLLEKKAFQIQVMKSRFFITACFCCYGLMNCDDDAVVWNPWEKKSKTMADFGDDEYKNMLCVDGAALERPITLKPGEEWTGKLMLTAVKSSFCFDQLELQSKGF